MRTIVPTVFGLLVLGLCSALGQGVIQFSTTLTAYVQSPSGAILTLIIPGQSSLVGSSLRTVLPMGPHVPIYGAVSNTPSAGAPIELIHTFGVPSVVVDPESGTTFYSYDETYELTSSQITDLWTGSYSVVVHSDDGLVGTGFITPVPEPSSHVVVIVGTLTLVAMRGGLKRSSPSKYGTAVSTLELNRNAISSKTS